MVSVILKIKGKVQGVFYRKNTKMQALKLGVKGFVQNRTNGSVYAEAEGGESQIEQLIEWCKNGPEKAEVTGIEVNYTEPKNHKTFEIKY